MRGVWHYFPLCSKFNVFAKEFLSKNFVHSHLVELEDFA